MSTAPVSHPPGAASADAVAWRAAVDKQLKGADFDRTLVARTRDDIPLGPVHPAADPVAPMMWRDPSRPIAVFARMDHPDAVEAEALAREDISGGAGGLVLTMAGAASARGFGLRADVLPDVLAGLPLRDVQLRLELAPFAPAQAVVNVLARSDADAEAVDVGLDPLGDAARCGSAPLPWPRLGTQARADVHALRNAGFTGGPHLRADGRVHHEAGATEAQELAAVLSTAVAYLRALDPLGPDEARRLIGFTLAADVDQLLTVAKLRALRVLWREVERACGCAPEPLRLHVETAWRAQTRRDPHTNLLRGTVGCAAAILGGADAVSVLPFTVPLGLPDRAARRLARHTPLVLLEEAHLGRVADPAAGSGAFEHLTAALCDRAWDLFQQIEREGGLAGSLARGAWQARLAATRERRRSEIADGAAPVIGTTVFMPDAEVEIAVLPVAREPVPQSAWGAGAWHLEPLPSRRDTESSEQDANA